MTRKELFDLALNIYSTEPEYPWLSDPEAAVLRHADNGKWFALIMNVPVSRIGIDSKEKADILNLKCNKDMVYFLREIDGVYPAYHMNKTNWISVLLDGPVPDDLIRSLLDDSFALTASKKRSRSSNKTQNGI